ncbi:MAG: hypothetical protein LBE34_03975 [Flavobacteriaceae bacterium]|jgi:hypothetical protein|nr:hypothetical protein [Flavobacteriaceae bacterium]
MGLFNFLNQNQKGEVQPKNSTHIEMMFSKEMASKAAYFVTSYAERFDELDYSVDSLKVVDNILDDIACHYEDIDDSILHIIVTLTSSYIFEVAKRNFGGKYYWHEQLQQPIFVTSQPHFEVSLLVFEKVKRRLKYGYDDHIPLFFDGFVNSVLREESAKIE